MIIPIQDLVGANLNEDQTKTATIAAKNIMHQHFPCTFASTSFKRNSIYLAYVECSKAKSVYASFVEILEEYSKLECNKDMYRVLIVVFPDVGLGSWQSDDDFMWKLLSYAVTHDKCPWPRHIPFDPCHPDWSFCFNEIEYFVNLNSPLHTNRPSRNVCDRLSLIIQRRDVFDDIKGEAQRKIIRERLERYDGQAASVYLGSYADEKNHEWKQYHLPDDNQVEIGDVCPFHFYKTSVDEF